MEQDSAHYDRWSSDSPDKSYDYLLCGCRRVIERNRVAWARSELWKSIAQGGRARVTQGQGKDGDKDKDKDEKGKGNCSNTAGDHRRGKSTNRNRFTAGTRQNQQAPFARFSLNVVAGQETSAL